MFGLIHNYLMMLSDARALRSVRYRSSNYDQWELGIIAKNQGRKYELSYLDTVVLSFYNDTNQPR